MGRLGCQLQGQKIIHDFDGPNRKWPLQLRIPTSKDVDFVSRAVAGKALDKAETQVKKPKQADLDKMKGRVFTGFNGLGSGEGNVESQQIAQGMVTGGAGNAFDNIGMSLPDITLLGARGDDQEETSADVAEGKSEEGSAAALTNASPLKRGASEITLGSGDGQQPPSGSEGAPAAGSATKQAKKRKWVDLGMCINTARRSLRLASTSMRSSLVDVQANLLAFSKEIQAQPQLVQQLFGGEMAVAEVRRRGCELVLASSVQDLTTWINSFGDAVAESGSNKYKY